MIRASKYILLTILFVVFLSVVNDTAKSESGVVRIRPSGGLNTIADDFTMPLEDARIAHNIDFSANIGGITVRKGYDSVSAISTAWDSLVSIYGAYYSDGSQQLFAVADSAGVGYGNVIFGAKGSSSLSSPTSAMGYWSIQNKTRFAMVNDKVYAVNGQQKGFVWDGRNARRWPLPSPGEPTICPLTYTGGSSYVLNGLYRYLVRSYIFDGGTPITTVDGALSASVSVSNGRVLLTDFTFPVGDSVQPSPDSVHIYISRTIGSYAPLDNSDTCFYVLESAGPTIRSIGQTLDSFMLGSSSTVARTYIDSMPDNIIGTAPYYAITPLATDRSRYGRIKTGYSSSRFGYNGRRYSAPTYLSKVDSTAAAYQYDSTHTTGLPFGVPKGFTLAGWAWAVTIVDTVNAIESDTTRSLFVIDTFKASASGGVSKPFSITIGLPRLASSVSGVMKNIYRAPVWIMGHDTAYVDSSLAGVSTFLTRVIWDAQELQVALGNPFWKKRKINDSLAIGAYYLVKTVPSTDTTFTDNIRYDSLINNDRYRYTTPPLLTNLFSFENRLYGSNASRLYFSTIDTVTRWGAFNSIAVSVDDGDIITTAFPSRGVIRVLKNRSNYNIFQGADLGWNRTEVSGYFGCIAPNSHVATINGHYYVSDVGVIRETEGPNLERTQSIELVSAKLKQFADFSASDAKKINAFSIPSEGKALFSKGDTTYVYDERTNTWATWDGVTFSDATLYGAETDANFLPGDSMYFIKSGSRTLFRYGSGSAQSFVYESAPFGHDTPYSKQVASIGVWANNISSSFGVQATLKDETGTNVTTPYVDFGTAIDGYTRYSFPNDYNSKSLYHRLRLAGSATGTFRAFDIYQKDIGETEER